MTALVVPLRRPLAGPVAALGAAGTYAAANVAVDPFADHEIGCPFLMVTGLWCPGCGSSRAANLVVHGDVVGSFAHHPLVVPVVALLAYLWVAWVVRQVAPERAKGWPSASRLPRWLPLGVGVAFAALWVARNIPGLEVLAPPT